MAGKGKTAAEADYEVSLIVAPTEPDKLKAIADTVSLFPEKKGCDVTWFAQGKWWGIQRKELKDFLASVQDGRLSREIAQMRESVEFPHLVIEGKINYDTEGNLVWNGWGQTYTRAQVRGMMWSIQQLGIAISYTNNLTETIEFIQMYSRWTAKVKHTSMMRRPGPTNSWGKLTNKDFAIHILQGFDGMGYDRAKAVVEFFGGAPLKWTVTDKELQQVPGIGKGIAGKLMKALGE